MPYPAILTKHANDITLNKKLFERIKFVHDHPNRKLNAEEQMLLDTSYDGFVRSGAPSRRGGEAASRPYRLQVASQLSQAVDSIYSFNNDAKIIVTGDFNDYSDSPALLFLEHHQLVNISQDAHGRNGAKGTYRFHGEWRSLDQIFTN